MSNQEIPLEELVEQSKQEVAKAIAAIYTVDQLSEAIKIRRMTEKVKQHINPFDTPAEVKSHIEQGEECCAPSARMCAVDGATCDSD